MSYDQFKDVLQCDSRDESDVVMVEFLTFWQLHNYIDYIIFFFGIFKINTNLTCGFEIPYEIFFQHNI